MKKTKSEGKCIFCSDTFSKAAMTRHLQSCKQRKAVIEALPVKGRTKSARIFHILVEGRYLPEYWMHIEAPANATLEDLDSFLRETWLECCGHLSAFRIGGVSYSADTDNEFGDEDIERVLGDVLSPGLKFYHEYDFGTTTELTLRVVSEREGVFKGKSVQLMARNNPPLIMCESCGKAAASIICAECSWSGGGWLCDRCAKGHECGEDMFLPVVNSPRAGECGYVG
ncbi:MAG: hypothetical protein HY786_00695 [Deltaproteobacteria bacterium]|nr:hypothetical protein [Deltaproteobacteria bacterium]